MKKFILIFLIWGTGALVIGFAMDFFISNKLKSSKTRMYIGWNDIYSGKFSSDVVIMGASEVWVQISPKILEDSLKLKTYNLGIDGSAIDRQVLKYNTYCRYNSKPKVIIQSIQFSTINKSNGYEREQFFPYFFYDKTLREESAQIEKFSVWEKYIPSFRYIGYSNLIYGAFGIKKFYSDDILTKGYFGRNWPWDGKNLAKIKKIEIICNPDALQLFNNYLDKAKNDGIKVVFVYCPSTRYAIDKIQNIDKMYAMYQQIADKYNIPILNYLNDPICDDISNFYNGMHLNKRGSEYFTAKLAFDLKAMKILDAK